MKRMKRLKRYLRSGAFLGFALLLVVVGAAPWARPAPKGLELVVEKDMRFIRAGRGQKPFDVTRHLIPLAGIRGGGPPRDGIPALTDPAFISAAEADEKVEALRYCDRSGIRRRGQGLSDRYPHLARGGQ